MQFFSPHWFPLVVSDGQLHQPCFQGVHRTVLHRDVPATRRVATTRQCMTRRYNTEALLSLATRTGQALQWILSELWMLSFQSTPRHKANEVVISRRCLVSVDIGQFACLLLSLEVVAISRAPSPESDPNSPLPVTASVGRYPTIEG